MLIAGGEKLLVNIFFVKLVSLTFFLLGSWLFLKISKNRNLVVVLWILNPFIINEMLVNGHNDLFMIVFFWLAIYWKQNSKTTLSVLAYLLSVGTKYLTAPLLPILFLSKKWQTILSTLSIVVIAGYLILHGNLPWYYSWIYFCLPYLKLNKGQVTSILFLQITLLLGYAGFLETGMWGPPPSSNVIILLSKSVWMFLPLFIFFVFVDLPKLHVGESMVKTGIKGKNKTRKTI